MGIMRTVRIVVCDDEEAVLEALRRKIEYFCEEKGTACEVVCLESGEEALGEEQPPDILFLDIQMSGLNGMEVAAQMRRRHQSTVLIFVTALSEYVYEAFDVGAFHYLVKPFQDSKLQEVLGRALEQWNERQSGDKEAMRDTKEPEADGTPGQDKGVGRSTDSGRCQKDVHGAILVKRGGVSTKVSLESIIYAEVYNRKVMLHTTCGDIEYYGKLTELSELAGEDFYRTHRAYLVNLKYVEKYNATTVWLEQGSVLVSKKQFPGFVRQYMQYIGRERDR